MLPFHAHFRRHTSPFRERREILFARIRANAAPGTPDDDDEEGEENAHQNAEANALDADASRNIGHTREDTRTRTEQVLDPQAEQPDLVHDHNAGRQPDIGALHRESDEEPSENDIHIDAWIVNLNKAKEEAGKLIQDMNSVRPQLEELARQTGAEGGASVQQFNREVAGLIMLSSKLGEWGEYMDKIKRWNQGNLSAIDLQHELQDQPMFIMDEDRSSDMYENLGRYITEQGGSENANNSNPLSSLNSSTKRRYFDEAGITLVAQEINDLVVAAQSEMKHLLSVKNVITEDYTNSGLANRTDTSAIQLTWFTINDLRTGAKNVINAYKDRWKSRDRRRQAAASLWLGRAFSFMPGSEEVEQLLRKTLEGEDAKARKEFRDYLASSRTSLERLIGKDGKSGLLSESQWNPTIFMASVEYMAEKGWLYKFDPTTGLVFDHFPLRIGSSLPANWTEADRNNYFDELRGLYSKGQANQKEAGKARGKDIRADAEAIRALHNQVEEMNYWGAIGVVEGMWEKAKSGNSSALATVTFLQRMRETDTKSMMFRKYFPYEALDKVSFAIQTPVYLPTFLKFDKGDIAKWQSDTSIPFSKAGKLAQTISALEADIRAAQIEAGHGDVIVVSQWNELISKALAGQILKAEDYGWRRSISLFDAKYDSFRESHFKNQANMDPSKADPTYYKSGDGGSEAIFMTADTLRNFLQTSGQDGRFRYGEIAEQMLGQILDRDDDFMSGGHVRAGLESARAKFRAEIGFKMSQAFLQAMNARNIASLITKQFEKKPEQFMLSQFFIRGICDKRVLFKLLQINPALARALLQQILDDEGARNEWTPAALVDIFDEKQKGPHAHAVLNKTEIVAALRALYQSGGPYTPEQIKGIVDALVSRRSLTTQEAKTIIHDY